MWDIIDDFLHPVQIGCICGVLFFSGTAAARFLSDLPQYQQNVKIYGIRGLGGATIMTGGGFQLSFTDFDNAAYVIQFFTNRELAISMYRIEADGTWTRVWNVSKG